MVMAYKKFSEYKVLMSKLRSYSEELPEDEDQIEALYLKIARKNIIYFGEKLKEARLEYGGAQGGMANSLNVRQATFSDWENGKSLPRIHNIKELVEIYQIDPGDLIEVNPLKLANDSFIPLVDNNLFIRTDFESFKHNLEYIRNVPRIPVSISDKLSFAYRVTDSSMFGGATPIYENSMLLCSTAGLGGKAIREQAVFCNSKICIVNVCGDEPLIRLLTFENNVLTLTAFNTKWPTYCFPEGRENLLNLNDVKDCIYKGHETHLGSVRIFGVVKKMYVEF